MKAKRHEVTASCSPEVAAFLDPGGTLQKSGLLVIDEQPLTAALCDALELAKATIERLERHAPGSARGTLDVVNAAIARAKAAA